MNITNSPESSSDVTKDVAKPDSARHMPVGIKLSMAAAFIVAVALTSLVSISAWNQREALIASEEQSFASITGLLASNVSGAVRWNKPEVVEAAYERFTANPDSSFASVRTWNKAKEEVTGFDSEVLAPGDLSAALAGSLESEDGVFQMRTGQHVVIAMPTGFGKDGERVGTLAVAWSLEAINRTVLGTTIWQAVAALVAMVILIGAMFLVSRRLVSSPLAHLTHVVSELSNGRTDVDLEANMRSRELNLLENAMTVWRERILSRKALEEEQRRAFEQREEHNRRREELIAEFDVRVRDVLQMFTDSTSTLDDTAQLMGSVSRDTNSQAGSVSAAAEQASANVATLSSVAGELSSSISEIAQQVQDATRVSNEAVDDMARTGETMQTLDEVVMRVGEVVKMIADIAEQTNLLALNATIEAARAGESGRGFAVVANEVKNLANQTATATEEVGQQISAIQNATKQAVGSIESVTGTINRMKDISSAIAAAIEQQSAATSEISRTVQETSEGAQEVTRVIAGVTEGAGKTDEAARAVLESGSVLTQQAAELRGNVESFLSGIRNVDDREETSVAA